MKSEQFGPRVSSTAIDNGSSRSTSERLRTVLQRQYSNNQKTRTPLLNTVGALENALYNFARPTEIRRVELAEHTGQTHWQKHILAIAAGPGSRA